MSSEEFKEAVRASGSFIDEPKNHWKCKAFGCVLPSARITVETVSDNNGTSGKAYSITCERCERRVSPWDDDYPTIRPGGVYSA